MQKELDKAFRSAKNALSTAKKQYIVYALRDTVKHFRKQRTASEEREFVKKQLAQVRDLSRQEDRFFRRRNVAKLVFFYLNGYNVDFGIMECVKLCASAKFKDKRIGYMALQVLLDEQAEVLLLVVNNLKQDLQSDNHQVVALALHALANLASAEVARDLAPDVERLLHSRNPFLRKKAALAAVRLCRRAPELADSFRSAALELLKMPHHHGVVICGLALLDTLLTIAPGALWSILRTEYLSTLLQMLRDTATAGFNAEYGFQGVCDPFLQCRLLQMLRRLIQSSELATEEFHRTLVDVARSSERSHAVSLECVRTILAMANSPPNNIAFAVQRLGDLLRSRDPNLRLTALQLLRQAATFGIATVAQHQDTIFECLHDQDPTIQRRALDLIFTIGSTESMKRIVDELVSYLSTVREPVYRYEILQRLWMLGEHVGSEAFWRLRCFFQAAGALPANAEEGFDLPMIQEIEAELADDVVATMLAYPSEGALASRVLFETISEQVSSTRSAVTLLLHIALAFTAEHGIGTTEEAASADRKLDILAPGTSPSHSNGPTSAMSLASDLAAEHRTAFPRSQSTSLERDLERPASTAVREDVIANIRLAQFALHLPRDGDMSLRQRQEQSYLYRKTLLGRLALDALFRTALRMGKTASATRNDCLKLIQSQCASLDLEAQQRAREYTHILGNASADTLNQLVSSLSLPESSFVQAWRKKGAFLVSAANARAALPGDRSMTASSMPQLISFDESEGESADPSPSSDLQPPIRPSNGTGEPERPQQNKEDGMHQIYTAMSALGTTSHHRDDLLTGETTLERRNGRSEDNSNGDSYPSIYEDEYLCIRLRLELSSFAETHDMHVIQLEAHFANKTPRVLTRFLFQVSVPKFIRLEMMPASAGSLPPSTQPQNVTQRLKLFKEPTESRPFSFRFRFLFIDPSGQQQVRQGVINDVLGVLGRG
jgi:hypothetical protein